MNVALSGLGIDEYREDFGSLDVLRFRYLYVGLLGLDGVQYLQRQRETTVEIIEKRFGSLTPDVRERLDRLSQDELNDLWRRFVDARTLDDLWSNGS